jgi:hypothetical protein
MAALARLLKLDVARGLGVVFEPVAAELAVVSPAREGSVAVGGVSGVSVLLEMCTSRDVYFSRRVLLETRTS